MYGSIALVHYIAHYIAHYRHHRHHHLSLRYRPQVNSGETYRIVLQSCGPDGQELDTGGALFRVHLTGHPDAFADIQDNNNGQYLIRVLAKEAGNYDLTLEVTLGGQHVVGSPAAISVVPPGLFKAGFWTGARTMDEAAANNFVMSGMGLSSTVAGATAEFEIASRRADEQTPAGSFVAEFRPAGHEADDVYGEVSGPRKGVYTCKYRLTVAGDYSLVVKLAKFTLSGCPRVVHVDADVTHAPSCKVHGEGTSGRVLRDAEQVFFVETADRFGNPTWHPQDRIFVEVRGGRLDIFKRRGVVRVRFRKAVVHARVDRVEGNLYRCSYTLRQVGYFGVIVRHQRAGDVNWVDLGESPYEVECYRTGHDKSRMSRTTAGGFMSREFTMAGARVRAQSWSVCGRAHVAGRMWHVVGCLWMGVCCMANWISAICLLACMGKSRLHPCACSRPVPAPPAGLPQRRGGAGDAQGAQDRLLVAAGGGSLSRRPHGTCCADRHGPLGQEPPQALPRAAPWGARRPRGGGARGRGGRAARGRVGPSRAPRAASGAAGARHQGAQERAAEGQGGAGGGGGGHGIADADVAGGEQGRRAQEGRIWGHRRAVARVARRHLHPG